MKNIFTMLSVVIIFATASLTQAQRPGGERFVLPVQTALDANNDGMISPEEIAQAPAALRKLDKNGDGQLTEDELRPAFGRGRGDVDGSPEEAVKRLMEFDKNGDGKLSKDELPERMQEMMERADTNHDGFLTPDELKQMVEQGGLERRRPNNERPPSK